MPAFHSVLLEIQKERTSRFYLRVEWASTLKGFFVVVVFVRGLGEIKGTQDHAGLVTAYLVSDYITSSSNCTRGFYPLQIFKILSAGLSEEKGIKP